MTIVSLFLIYSMDSISWDAQWFKSTAIW